MAATTSIAVMRTLKAFLVEDSPVIQASLVAALEELAPMEIVGMVDDERSAVHWLKGHACDCDVVITDIFLKSGSGLGVLQAASRLGNDSLELIVITNYATPDMRRKCSELGAKHVFDKSREIDGLIAYCSGLAARAEVRGPR